LLYTPYFLIDFMYMYIYFLTDWQTKTTVVLQR